MQFRRPPTDGSTLTDKGDINMNASKIFTGLFCLIISLAFLGAGIWIQFYRNTGYVETTATITHIEKTSNGSGTGKHRTRSTYVAYVEYEVDGVTYSGPSDIWESGMVKGQQITIYYNPDNPAEMGGDAGWLGWFIIGIGAVSTLGAFAIMFKKD